MRYVVRRVTYGPHCFDLTTKGAIMFVVHMDLIVYLLVGMTIDHLGLGWRWGAALIFVMVFNSMGIILNIKK